MFRSKLIRSVVAAGRTVVKLAMTMRPLSLIPVRMYSTYGQFYSLGIQQRFFSTNLSSAADIKQRIEACTFNDAAKEKIISEEAKKKNFEALRELGEELIYSHSLSNRFVEKPETKELGILCFVQAADNGDTLSQFAVGNLYMQRYWQEKMKPDL